MKFILVISFLCPVLLFSQAKEKFVREKYLHLKVGTVLNFTNYKIYEILNTPEMDVFTSQKSIFFNPAVDIEFENRFSKRVGISIDLGFMQTHQRYDYSSNWGPNVVVVSGYDQGLILCNIPHLNINPSFYVMDDTRFYAGFGIYKYYYSFKPTQAGSLFFDLNSEGLSIYSNVGIAQSFDVKAYRFTATVNYFGLTRRYDSGIQVALGIAL